MKIRVPLGKLQLIPFDHVEWEDDSLHKERVFLPAYLLLDKERIKGWVFVHLEDRKASFYDKNAAKRADLYRKLTLKWPGGISLWAIFFSLMSIPFYYQSCDGLFRRHEFSFCTYETLSTYPFFRFPLLLWFMMICWAVILGILWWRDKKAKPIADIELPQAIRMILRRASRTIFRIMIEDKPKESIIHKGGEAGASLVVKSIFEGVGDAAGGRLGKSIGKHGYRALTQAPSDKEERIREVRLQIMNQIFNIWKAEQDIQRTSCQI